MSVALARCEENLVSITLGYGVRQDDSTERTSRRLRWVQKVAFQFHGGTAVVCKGEGTDKDAVDIHVVVVVGPGFPPRLSMTKKS